MSTLLILWLAATLVGLPAEAQRLRSSDKQIRTYKLPRSRVGWRDWSQNGGTSVRNNAPIASGIPHEWDVEKKHNVKWIAKLGSVTHSAPIVANGKVFIGTNNEHGHVARSAGRDASCLLCFDEGTGEFLWQHLNEKLPAGRVHDWPMTGIVGVPAVLGDRLWYVTNRGEVVCLDVDGFYDGRNDGVTDEPVKAKDEADVVWRFDMMAELGVLPHNQFTCSVTCSDTAVFVVSGNGVGADHNEIQANAPDFLALDRETGKVLWTDSTPGEFVLHGSWSSPSYAVLGGQPQVLFPGGDGWLYSFDPKGDGKGGSKLLWKFDCNPKDWQWELGGRGHRVEFVPMPVIYEGQVFVTLGSDVEHGVGPGRIWCIDPTKKFDGSDVSPTRAVDASGNQIPRRRFRAVDPAKGERAIPNPNSAMVWSYSGTDFDGDGKLSTAEEWHRTCAAVTVWKDMVFAGNIEGFVHCISRTTGKGIWSHDILAPCWQAQPLVVDHKVFVPTEDGEVVVMKATREPLELGKPLLHTSVHNSVIVANGTLFVADRSRLYAISDD